MGNLRPDARDLNGDESVVSPRQGEPSLLAAERSTNRTKRIESDALGNVYVNVAADSVTPGGGNGVSPLASAAITSVPDNTLSTIVTYTAGSAVKITNISCGGSIYAKFQLFKNTVLIDTFRSGPARAVSFNFTAGLALIAGDILDVKVTHYVTGSMEEFESTIYGG